METGTEINHRIQDEERIKRIKRELGPVIEGAVAAEREACAKIARQQGCSDPECQECAGGNIERLILARS